MLELILCRGSLSSPVLIITGSSLIFLYESDPSPMRVSLCRGFSLGIHLPVCVHMVARWQKLGASPNSAELWENP